MAVSTTNEDVSELIGRDNLGEEYETSEEFWSLQDEREWYKVLDEFWKSNSNASVSEMLGGLQQKVHKSDVKTSLDIVKKYFNHCIKSKRKENVNNTNNDKENNKSKIKSSKSKNKGKKTKGKNNSNQNETNNATNNNNNINCLRAIDCGGGIGRTIECVLGPMFDKVDLCEINPLFCKEYTKRQSKKAYFDQVFCSNLRQFSFNSKQFPNGIGIYNCIWFQWVLEHLSDDDLINFLKRCKKALKNSSPDNDNNRKKEMKSNDTKRKMCKDDSNDEKWDESNINKYIDDNMDENEPCFIVIKENVVQDCLFYVSFEDSSMIRHVSLMQDIFAKAQLSIVEQLEQPGFPDDLYPTMIWILR